MCLAVRPVGCNQRALVFRCFRVDAVGTVCRSGRYLWTSSEIGRRDWIWSGFGAVAGLAAGCSWSENRGIPPFLDWCGLRPLPNRLFLWTDSGIGPRNRIRSLHGCVIGCVPD